LKEDKKSRPYFITKADLIDKYPNIKFPKKEGKLGTSMYDVDLRGYARWEENTVAIQPLPGFDEVLGRCDIYHTIERTRHLKTIGDFQIAFDFCLVRAWAPYWKYWSEVGITCKCYRFLTNFSEIQVNDSNLSIEHLLSVTIKRHLHLGGYIDDIMEALYKNDVKSTDEDVAKLLKYVGNPKYLAFLRPGLRGLCVKNIHDLKNWFYYYKKSALLPSEIKALFVVDKYQNLRLCLSSRHVFCANGEAVFAAGEMTFQFSESPKTGKTKRQEMDVCITHITNKSWDYRPSLDSWAFVDAALRELEIDFPDGFTKEYVYTEGV
jgi:hypothetical protein